MRLLRPLKRPRNDGIMDSRFRGNDKEFKPYYVAHTKIRTLALLDEEHKGSNWYHWRRVKDSNLRTSFEVTRFRGVRFQPLSQLSTTFYLYLFNTFNSSLALSGTLALFSSNISLAERLLPYNSLSPSQCCAITAPSSFTPANNPRLLE